jgi:predicted AlkP superfamily phosphohydrolase/phosphomutase
LATSDPQRTVAIGLDGCSWNVLEPLLATGELPCLAGLRERGAFGVLESTIPFYTGPAWASFATGCSPAAHGIYDFMMVREGGRLGVATQHDLRRGTYYEQLAREGRRSVLVNLPLDLYGSENTVIVNSWLTAGDERRILPRELSTTYASELAAYQSYPTTFNAPFAEHVAELCALEQSRFDLVRELFLREEWDHFFVLFSSTDWLGHAGTGRFLASDGEAVEAFVRLYRQLDGYVGWLSEQAPDATMVVLSDHGQCEETDFVKVNAVLRELGFVKTLGERPGARTVPSALGPLRRVRPARALGRRLRSATGRAGVEVLTPRLARNVDLAASSAFSPTTASYAVYTRDLGDDDIETIRESLESISLDDGRSALDGIWPFDELYGGADAGAPTLVFAPAGGVRPSIEVDGRIVGPAPRAGRGAHQRDGILLVGGPHARSRELPVTSLCDVTPTLLWAMGAAVPECDGRVLFEAFVDDFASRPQVTSSSVEPAPRGSEGQDDAEEAEVVGRLKALGYL